MRIIEERAKDVWMGPGVNGFISEVWLELDDHSDVFINAMDVVDGRAYCVANQSYFAENSDDLEVYESYDSENYYEGRETSKYYDYIKIADRILDGFEEDNNQL